MTSHSELTGIGTNIKPRRLWCPKCRTIVINDKAAPRCEECNAKLITVVFDELATRHNPTT